MNTPHLLTRRLPELRRALLTHRRDLLGRVTRNEEDLRTLAENVEPELADEAQEETTAQCLTGLDDLERRRLHAIDTALGRMARGEYGTCLACGEAVGMARLAALPEAAECVRCADAPRVGSAE